MSNLADSTRLCLQVMAFAFTSLINAPSPNWESNDNEGHFTHEIEGPSHFKHSHWWKKQSQSKFASYYTRGTNRGGECNTLNVKSTLVPIYVASNGSCFIVT
jgi:hypothetical protein